MIYNFQIHNVGNILRGKHISLNFFAISQIFKLQAKGIVVPA
jgi:hypothetical protein